MSVEISRYEKAMKLSDADFKQIIDVTKKTFGTMVEILHEASYKKHLVKIFISYNNICFDLVTKRDFKFGHAIGQI